MKAKTKPKWAAKCSAYLRRGIKVRDAKNEQRIRVRSLDIDGAICSDHQKCVIARAIKRQLHAEWVDVGAGVVLIKQPNKPVRRFLLDKLAREQVRYFDTHKGLYAPCDVFLVPPIGKHRLGNRHDKSARSGPSGRAKPKAPTR
jgi:hypothetical protein